MSSQTDRDVVRAYHLTSAEHAVSNISLRRLKVARLSEVNDPFELRALNCMKRELRRGLDAFRESQDTKFGLLSFSERWKSPVLWSHYAAGHKGICLGFDIKRDIGVRGIQHVRYEDDKLQAIGNDPEPKAISQDLQDLLFVTKYRHWAYEEELRVFVELSQATREAGIYFYPFSEDLKLREVILGHLCPTSLLQPIRTLVHATHPGAVVSKARLGFKYFEVKPDARHPPK
jgi:hypothetical protein